jgi:FkbM family methyltransferase
MAALISPLESCARGEDVQSGAEADLSQLETSAEFSPQRDLIFDIGVNHGEDSEFYLAKGFRVVGVEADPILASELRKTFHRSIETGQYTLENIGISSEAGTLPFYRNLYCDHWSSFDKTYGARNGTQHEVISVRCVKITDLIARFGCPYYMKVDIEGADRHVLDTLFQTEIRPRFISIEEFSAQAIEFLFRMGYNMFSLRTQQDKTWAVPPNPPREGKFIARSFTPRDSGLFGFEVPEWMSCEAAKDEYSRKVRNDRGEWLPPPGEWYDIHATYWPVGLDDQALERK